MKLSRYINSVYCTQTFCLYEVTGCDVYPSFYAVPEMKWYSLKIRFTSENLTAAFDQANADFFFTRYTFETFCKNSWPWGEGHSEIIQNSKMNLFAKIGNCSVPLTIFTKNHISDVWLHWPLKGNFKKLLWNDGLYQIFS